MNVAAITK